MMRKVFKISILLSLVLLFTFNPRFCADAEADVVANDGRWSFNEETGVLTVYKNLGDYHVQSSSSPYILATPWEVEGIGANISSVIICEGVTRVGNLTFAMLRNLCEVSFPQTLTSIGAEAFYDCRNLTNIEIPASVSEIGWGAFRDCGNISSITVHGRVPAIGNYSFWYDGWAHNRDREIFSSISADVYYYSDDWPNEKYGASVLTWHKMTCSEHNVIIDEAVLPNCTKAGHTEGSHCSICGEIITAQETIPALGHSVVIDEGIAPTCTEPGLTEGSHCEVCSAVITAQRAIAPAGHTIENDEAIAPTCTETGLTEGSHCTVCGEILKAQEEVSALGHSWIMDEQVEATCTTKGLTAGIHCDRCGEIHVAQEEIPMTEHSPVVDDAVDPTCTTNGMTEGSHCRVCGVILVEQTEIPAMGHSPVIDAIIFPNCTETGLTEGSHCEICGEIIKAQEPIAALGHISVNIPEVLPTCTETGLTEGWQCTRCKEILVVQETIPAFGHDWDDGVITKASTCKTEGTKQYTCKNNSSHIKEENLPVDTENHFLTKVDIVYPTETEDGHIDYWQCDDCGKMFKDDEGTEEIQSPTVIPIFRAPDFLLPFNLTVIEEEAFEGIQATVVAVPDSCTKIGTHAFRNSNISQIQIPEDCEIEDDVFEGCAFVFIYGKKGSSAEGYSETHENCCFVELSGQ